MVTFCSNKGDETMDGSLVEDAVLAELEKAVSGETAWTDVRKVVRAWAAKHWFLPCTTSPTVTGLSIAYHDEALGCKKVFVPLPADQADKVLREYEAGKDGW
ncbi:hypothetical protein K2P47_00745 [Patescibacteria group bacterium]|nr:hypothetical protein [Patescibacteria group bacterium]